MKSVSNLQKLLLVLLILLLQVCIRIDSKMLKNKNILPDGVYLIKFNKLCMTYDKDQYIFMEECKKENKFYFNFEQKKKGENNYEIKNLETKTTLTLTLGYASLNKGGDKMSWTVKYKPKKKTIYFLIDKSCFFQYKNGNYFFIKKCDHSKAKFVIEKIENK